MDRKYIDDHHVVARYLAEQLSEAEREAFEIWYLQHPDVVQELEAAARFKVGLMQLRDSGELNALLHPTPRIWQRPYFAAAAAVAVMAIGSLMVIQRLSFPEPALLASAAMVTEHTAGALSVASVHALLHTRGDSNNTVISLPKTPQFIELRVLPDTEAEPARYQVSLTALSGDDGSREVATLHDLPPESDGFVPVYLNSTHLAPGQYRLTLSGAAGTSAADESSVFTLLIRSSALEEK